TSVSSAPTTYLREINATQHRRPIRRLLRLSRGDGTTGKTVVGKAQNVRSTSSAGKRLRSQPAHFHQGQRQCRTESPDVRLQSPIESSPTESLANRGRPCTDVRWCSQPGC